MLLQIVCKYYHYQYPVVLTNTKEYKNKMLNMIHELLGARPEAERLVSCEPLFYY